MRQPFLTLARLAPLAAAAALLTGCFGEREPAPALPPPAAARSVIDAALPAHVSHRAAWASDLDAAFKALQLTASREHVCAVVAVIEQESGFEVDPVVPGLGAIAWREIDRRAAQHGIPPAVLREVLKLRSSDGRSYAERIDAARTEKDLSDIFEDFTGSVPLGRTLFASSNPIRTRGPMQVNVAFAERFAKTRPYPFALEGSLADELFTRAGSLYFGIAHLLAIVGSQFVTDIGDDAQYLMGKDRLSEQIVHGDADQFTHPATCLCPCRRECSSTRQWLFAAPAAC